MTVSVETGTSPAHAAHKSGTLSPREQGVLWEIEEHFWTSGADNARATTATNAVMIVPHPLGILQGDQLWTHLRQRTGWRSVVMAERRVMRCRDIAILTYRISAEKPDVPIYKALCASTYLNDDDHLAEDFTPANRGCLRPAVPFYLPLSQGLTCVSAARRRNRVGETCRRNIW